MYLALESFFGSLQICKPAPLPFALSNNYFVTNIIQNDSLASLHQLTSLLHTHTLIIILFSSKGDDDLNPPRKKKFWAQNPQLR